LTCALDLGLAEALAADCRLGDEGDAGRRQLAGIGIAKRIEAPGAQRGAAVGRAQQALDLALQHGVVHVWLWTDWS
jgi:hypothetical protein